MFQIQVEAVFKADYKRVTAAHPQIKQEFKAAVVPPGEGHVAYRGLPSSAHPPRHSSHRSSSVTSTLRNPTLSLLEEIASALNAELLVTLSD